MVESLFEAVTHTTRELTKYRFSALEFALLVQQPNMINVEITDVEMVAFLLRSPLTLSALFAHKNLAFIGSPGMDTPPIDSWPLGEPAVSTDLGVTSLKITDLQDHIPFTRRSGRKNSLLSYLIRLSSLIINEVEYCKFDKENTPLFFDMVNLCYQKEYYSNIYPILY